MELKKISFNDFKSIKNASLIINEKCLVLVGKNEAGKSNILKGINSLLNLKEKTTSLKDLRKAHSKEMAQKQDNIIADIIFSENEIKEIIKIYKLDFLNGAFSYKNEKEKFIDTTEFINTFYKKMAIVLDIKDAASSLRYYSYNNLIYNENIAETKASFSLSDGTKYTTGDIINISQKKDIIESNIKILSYEEIRTKILEYIRDYFSKKGLKCIFWEDNENYLLPKKIKIEDFMSNPSKNIPLRNLFFLAGYSDIEEAFSEAIERDGDYENLLDDISDTATKTFKEKWPDLKDISIRITADGEYLLSKVKERVKFDFDERSDGFQHFISILLMLSCQIETGTLKNTLILLDEPDRSLYPTGAKYLRDELIKLSEKDGIYVIYATHSPFMIDRKCIERHKIVEKREATSILEVSESSYSEDEILLNAIGTSIFEDIKETNIIFEGWTDYILLKKALESKKREYKVITTFFSHFGFTYSHGASGIGNIISILILMMKKGYVLSDSDKAGKDQKKNFSAKNPLIENIWFTFEDIGGEKDQTAEDYIKLSYIKKILQENNISCDINESKPIMSQLECLSSDEKKKVKKEIAKSLKPSDIKDIYFERLNTLKEKIEAYEKQSS